MTQFLHKKADSNVWYYRRRFPKNVASVINKAIFIQSLKTTIKRDAERLSRQVSVQFDAICQEALVATEVNQVVNGLNAIADTESNEEVSAEEVLARVPALIKQAAERVVEEQLRNPQGWQEVVKGWKSLYEAIIAGRVPYQVQRPAIEAQAILNGFEAVIQGKPIPEMEDRKSIPSDSMQKHTSSTETWRMLCNRALSLYREKVGSSRYKMAEKRLPEVNVASTSESHIQAGLRFWCEERLQVVQPRTVRTQLDGMLSALRCVLPNLKSPQLKQLQGVMQPRVSDRKSMPVQAIRAAIEAVKARPVGARIRKDFEGGASQFDDIAIETLAVLGIRPRELVQAGSGAILYKTDVFGVKGLYFRIALAKNKASEREIPLSDGKRDVLNVSRLREMLKWQEENQRSPSGAVTSLNTRFKQAAGPYTLYQMRHSWKDVAVHADVDFELRERMLGHAVKGVAAVYGSGIPLVQGIDALLAVRSKIYD